MSGVEPDAALLRADSTTALDMRSAASQQARAAIIGDVAIRLANLVIGASAERGITLMPLKGVLLLSRWPELRGARDLVDVDFIVQPSELDALTTVLTGLGFEANTRSTAARTFAHDSWPLSLDVHRDLFPHGLFAMTTEELFSRAEVDASLFSAPVARMSDRDLFAHLVGHFVKGRESFRDATSLRDLRLLSKRRLWRDPAPIGHHLRALGLQRAAGYVLGHPSFRDEHVPSRVLRSLDLSPVDRLTIAIARLGTRMNRGVPPWWTPHLLDRSLVAGSRSLLGHLDEGRRRLMVRLTERLGSTWRTTSANRATP